MPPPWIFFPEVVVDCPTLEHYEEDFWDGWEPDENARAIAAVDEELNEEVRAIGEARAIYHVPNSVIHSMPVHT
jgi:hypothetical protein